MYLLDKHCGRHPQQSHRRWCPKKGGRKVQKRSFPRRACHIQNLRRSGNVLRLALPRTVAWPAWIQSHWMTLHTHRNHPKPQQERALNSCTWNRTCPFPGSDTCDRQFQPMMRKTNTRSKQTEYMHNFVWEIQMKAGRHDVPYKKDSKPGQIWSAEISLITIAKSRHPLHQHHFGTLVLAQEQAKLWWKTLKI